MKARTKFLIGGALVLGVAGYLMATSIRDTGVYYFTPTELSAKLAADSSFREAGVKLGARVVPGSIVRKPGGKDYAFRVTDGAHTFPVIEVKNSTQSSRRSVKSRPCWAMNRKMPTMKMTPSSD